MHRSRRREIRRERCWKKRGGTCSRKVGEEVLEEGRKVVLPCEMSKRAKGEHLMGESKRLKQKLARSRVVKLQVNNFEKIR